MDRDWLYYGVPITTGRIYGPTFRFWKFATDPGKAWCIEYRATRKKPYLVMLDVDRLRISQRPSEPPPMPDWACEEQEQVNA